MWLGGGLNPEAWFKLKVKEGLILEGSVRDDSGKPQGTILLRVNKPVEKDASGHLFTGEFLTASDSHYRWWMREGAGKSLRRSCHYHSCGVRADECPYTKGRTKIIHLERMRLIGAKEWRAGIPEWCFKQPCKRDVESFHSRFMNEKGSEAEGVQLPWAEPESEAESSEVQGGEEDEDTAAKIAKLKAKLKALEAGPAGGKTAKKKKRADAEKKAKDKQKAKKHRPSDGSDSDVKKKKKDSKKEKRGKKRRKRRGESSDSKDSKQDAADRKKRAASPEDSSNSSEEEQLFQSKPKKRSKKDIYPKHGDRGPFGAGIPVEFGDEKSSDSDSGSVFRDAPAPQQKSGQLALMTYSYRKPGRLAARLLMKMRSEVAMGAAGAQDESSERTPPTGVQYLITILLPQLGAKANLRTQRELRTLMVSLDLLAKNCPARAADVICQRVKALERASSEGSWSSAQFLELIPAENASLLERDEEVFISKEALLEQKLKKKDTQGGWKGGAPRGDRKGEKGRGKGLKGEDGPKGRGKESDKTK